MNAGIWYALGAYAAWGFFPVYWKWLHHVPAPQLLGHRILWSFLSLVVVIAASRKWEELRLAIRDRRILRSYAAASVLIGINWLMYVWAVNAGHIVETSLGYFINPLLSVVFGVLFLGERLRPWQWLPVGLATAGVVYLAIDYGSPPWIALILAFSFALYGLIKKRAPLGSLHGLTLETGYLVLPALVYLAYCEITGTGAFLHTGVGSDLLMAGAGLVTTLPLLMFASAARRIPLSLVGILQYIAPTVQFLIGVLLYHEPLTRSKLLGFVMVWVALLIFAIEGYLSHRSRAMAVVAEAE